MQGVDLHEEMAEWSQTSLMKIGKSLVVDHARATSCIPSFLNANSQLTEHGVLGVLLGTAPQNESSYSSMERMLNSRPIHPCAGRPPSRL